MKIAISCVKGNFSCFHKKEGYQDNILKVMGFKIVEVQDDEGQEILAAMARATELQLHLRDLFESE